MIRETMKLRSARNEQSQPIY